MQVLVSPLMGLKCDGVKCDNGVDGPARQEVVGTSWDDCSNKARRLGWVVNLMTNSCFCPACADKGRKFAAADSSEV